MIGLVATALAHHGTAVGQVGPRTDDVQQTVGQGPRMEVGVDATTGAFIRTLRGRDPTDDTAGIWLQQLTLRAGVHLEGGGFVRLRVPAGFAVTRDDAGQTFSVGAGDLALQGGLLQERFGVTLAVSMPTGAYRVGEQLSHTDLAGEDGELLVTTYDTRASLGLGAFALGGRGDVRAPLGPALFRASAGMFVPFTETPDGITWGPSLDANVSLGSAEAPRFGGALFLGARHHLPDHRIAYDEDLGQDTLQSFGRRSELAVGAGRARLTDKFRCSASVEIPVFQQVQGVQLVEAIGGRLGCRAAAPLRKQGADVGASPAS